MALLQELLLISAAIVIVFVTVSVALICQHISSQDKRRQETVQPRLAAAANVQGDTKQ